MRITAIECQHLRLPLDPPFHAAWDPVPRRHFDATIVRVHTDEGLVGVASGDTMAGFGEFAPLFLGRDPRALALHARALETVAFHAGRYWPLEAALWDLLGVASGVAVVTLLGGARERLPAYASLGERRSPGQRAEDASALVGAGFRAAKVRIDPSRLDDGLAVLAAIRAAVGDRLALIVDLNQAWRMPGDIAPASDRAAARRVIERVAEYDPLWVEEPLPLEDFAGLASLRQGVATRVAGGEMARAFEDLRRALAADALDVYQPDAVLALGLTGARTVAELALRQNRWFTPHTWTNGIGLLVNLHLCAGVGGGPYLEYPYDPPTWTPRRRDFMLAEPVAVDGDGTLAVPASPGLGVALDEEAVGHYAIASERFDTSAAP